MGLPEGVSLLNTVGILAAVGIVTVMLRQLPFSALRLLKGSNLVGMLGMTMPVGVMTVLVVYTIAHQTAEPGGIWSSLIASAVTLAVHWWRRSAALSIVAGTVCYMVIVNLKSGNFWRASCQRPSNSSLLRIVAEISGMSA